MCVPVTFSQGRSVLAQALRLVDAEYYVYHTRFELCRRGEPSSAFCYAMNIDLGVGSTASELQRDLFVSLGPVFRVKGD